MERPFNWIRESSKYMDKVCEQLDERCKEFDVKRFAPDDVEIHEKTEYYGRKPYKVLEWEDGYRDV